MPPSSLELSVTIMAPTHTITKTSANSGPPSFEPLTLDPCNILKKVCHVSYTNKLMLFNFLLKTNKYLHCHECA